MERKNEKHINDFLERYPGFQPEYTFSEMDVELKENAFINLNITNFDVRYEGWGRGIMKHKTLEAALKTVDKLHETKRVEESLAYAYFVKGGNSADGNHFDNVKVYKGEE